MGKTIKDYLRFANKAQEELDRAAELENETGRFRDIFRHARQAYRRGAKEERHALKNIQTRYKNTIRDQKGRGRG